VRIAEAVCNSFEELKEFKREVFGAKSYFLVKE
jgi:predicted secreted protein